MTYGVDCDRAYCCGFQEIGHFADDECSMGNYSEDSDITGETFEELLESIRESQADGVVLHIWFFKRKRADGTFEPEYEWDALRQLVRAIPNVLHIAETRNPNSGNMVDGYSWINKQ